MSHLLRQTAYFHYTLQSSSSNVPERPAISNCGTPMEKVPEFLDFYLKPLMQNSWTYIGDCDDFINKLERIGKIPAGSLLGISDVVGLYPQHTTQ